MSLYEERQLLKKLNSLEEMVSLDPEANRLRRKLKVRQVVQFIHLVCYFMGPVTLENVL